MNHTHHHHPAPDHAPGDTASLLSSGLLMRLAIAGAMAGVMWLTILWSLA